MIARLTREAIDAAAQRLGVDAACVRAVAEVEASGDGFLPDGRPKILFEGHHFSKRTGGAFDKSHPKISYPRWTRRFYLGDEREHDERLAIARTLNEEAALLATSWGAFQIMGFNFRAAGFGDVRAFVDAMHESADAHLAAFVAFIESEGLAIYLRRGDWVAFTARYNGPGQVQVYAPRLERAYRNHAAA